MLTHYVPNTVMTLKGRRPVLTVKAHPPNQHAGPIRADLTAVEVVTDAGSRWYGCARAWIGSDLEMHVEGFDPRFEEMAAWPKSEA